MAEPLKRPLRVFLCHASADKPAIRMLYKRLVMEGIDAWLDEAKLMPGQYWRDEISAAVQKADAVIVCLSKNSITKEGFIQKEIRFALDFAEEKPEGTIYLIPARLEECEVPHRLQYWQWVDLFFDGKYFNESGYQNLMRSLKVRAKNIGALLLSDNRLQTERENKNTVAQKVNSPKPSVNKAENHQTDLKQALPPVSNASEPMSFKEMVLSEPLYNPKIIIAKLLNLFKKTNKMILGLVAIISIFFMYGIILFANLFIHPTYSLSLPSLAEQTQASFINEALTATAKSSTQTPVIYVATATSSVAIANAATATVGAALTQAAKFQLTNIPFSTSVTYTIAPVFSPTSTFLSSSNATLLLDKNYLCKDGPGLEYNTVVTMIKGIRLPIMGRSEKDKWWFVQVQLENFENSYCWVNGGIVEGNSAGIVIVKP